MLCDHVGDHEVLLTLSKLCWTYTRVAAVRTMVNNCTNHARAVEPPMEITKVGSNSHEGAHVLYRPASAKGCMFEKPKKLIAFVSCSANLLMNCA